MAQGMKVEKQIRDLFFIPWLLLIADFFQGSGFAAADKRGEPQEGGWRPPPCLKSEYTKLIENVLHFKNIR